MDSNVSDVAEADADILTFDISDDTLERAAGAAPVITLALCTFHWHDCTWPQAKPEAPTNVCFRG
jgi:hypothetical protein